MALKKRLALIMAIIAICAFTFGLTLFNVNAKDGELSTVDYQQTYVLGSTVQIADATISYGGTDYPATAKVIFPSGGVYSLDSVKLTESGVYTVEYCAKVDGKVIAKQVEFTVSDQLFTIDGKGEFSYGTNSYLGEMGGVNVALTSGAVLRYNKVIDVSDNIQGTLPILRMYCTPQVKGEREIENVLVTLTDVYNPDNFIEVIYKGDVAVDQYTYTTGNANGQLPSGLAVAVKASASTINYEGKIYKLYQNSKQYGMNARSSFSGIVPKGMTMEDNYLELNMDYDQRRLYVQRAVNDSSDNLLIDLDEPLFFGDNLWNGFTTGEVIVTIEGVSYNSSNFNFFITELDGNDLQSTSVRNQTPPSIEVDFGEYSEDNLPTIIVGHSAKVFSASASDDLEGNVECRFSVYYNYNNSSRTLVNIKDGVFTPTREGVYTICYKAVDGFGNQTIKTVNLNAIVRENIEYTLSDYQTEFSIGEEVTVAQATVLNYLVGYTIDVKARHKTTGTVYDISKDELKFNPIYAGEYVIEYVYSDYVESKTFSYDITVKQPNAPVFFDDAAVPRYFIKNCTHYIPDYYAYDYSNGLSQIKAEIFFREDGGEAVKLSSNYLKIEGQNNYEIIYKAGETEKVYSCPVVDTNYGVPRAVKFAEYLQGNAFTATANSENITYTTNVQSANEGVAKLSLINAAYVNVFNAQFSVGDSGFEKISFILTSVEDRSKTASVTYSKNSLGTTDVCVKYSDVTVNSVSTSSFEKGNDFQVTVFNNKLVVSGSDVSIPVSQMFETLGDKFFVDIELSGITGNASIKINKLMNQNLSSNTSDQVLPIIVYTPLRDDYKINEVALIESFDTYDFVDPSPSFEYKVKDESNTLTSESGVLMDGTQNYREQYQIKITKYGTIKLSYTIGDYSSSVWGDDNGSTFTVTVADITPPVINLNVKSTVAKVGKVTIADYSVTDDSNGDVKVTVCVIDADGVISVIDGKQFNASKKGTYTIIYKATDADLNVTFAQYNITVK